MSLKRSCFGSKLLRLTPPSKKCCLLLLCTCPSSKNCIVLQSQFLILSCPVRFAHFLALVFSSSSSFSHYSSFSCTWCFPVTSTSFRCIGIVLGGSVIYSLIGSSFCEQLRPMAVRFFPCRFAAYSSL